MDLINISGRMETHTQGSRIKEKQMVMAFTDGKEEKHITGSGIKVKEMDMEL